MKKIILLSVMALLASCSNSTYVKEEHKTVHWGYQGNTGPSNWAKISPKYSACLGKNQSPVNLTGFVETDLKPLAFHYNAGGKEIINNGHTIQVNYQKGSSFVLDGTQFNLLQFHFHTPSENNINDKSYPLEAHLVHSDSKGNLAVVAVMFTEGAENTELAKAWSKMPKHTGDKHAFASLLNVNSLLPRNKDYYRFNGSLTTPPCSEGVRWVVMKKAMTVSKAQIEEFAHVLHHPNNRPIQATNARLIMK